MKNTIDAVNACKSEWHAGNEFLVNDESKGHWFFTNNKQVRSFHGSYRLVCTNEEFNQCVEDCSNNFGKESKPIYTQAMRDEGIALDIGMMFATEAGEYHVDNINDKSICFVDEDGFYIGIPIGKAKPIDTRTDEEKGFDKFLSDQYNSNIAELQGSESDVDFITGLQSAWKAAINFQLLEGSNHE